MEITKDEFNAMLQTNDIVFVAKVCYGAKKAYMEAKGDFYLTVWDDETQLQRDIEIQMVERILLEDDIDTSLYDETLVKLYKAIINTLK